MKIELDFNTFKNCFKNCLGLTWDVYLKLCENIETMGNTIINNYGWFYLILIDILLFMGLILITIVFDVLFLGEFWKLFYYIFAFIIVGNLVFSFTI